MTKPPNPAPRTRAKAKAVERTRCAACGVYDEGAAYHPFALCALAQVLGEDSARANLQAVMDYARKHPNARITPIARRQ